MGLEKFVGGSGAGVGEFNSGLGDVEFGHGRGPNKKKGARNTSAQHGQRGGGGGTRRASESTDDSSVDDEVTTQTPKGEKKQPITDKDVAYISRQMGVDSAEALKMLQQGFDIEALRKSTGDVEEQPEDKYQTELYIGANQAGEEDILEQKGYDWDTAARHAEVANQAVDAGYTPEQADKVLGVDEAMKEAEYLEMAKRAGIEDYRRAEGAIKEGALSKESLRRNYARPIVEEAVSKFGISPEKARELLIDGTMDAEALRNMPEVVERPAETIEETPADKILEILEQSRIPKDELDRAAESLGIQEIAKAKISETELGKALDAYVEKQAAGSKGRRKAEAEQTIWIAREQDIIRDLSDLRAVYADLKLGDHTLAEKSEIEKKMRVSAKKIQRQREILENHTYKKIASLVGYEGDLPVEPEGKVGLSDNVGENNDNYNTWLVSMERGELTEDAEAYFDKVGILDKVRDVFDDQTSRSIMTRIGEGMSGSRIIGGDKNAYPETSTFIQNEEAFRDFLHSREGTQCLLQVAKSMADYDTRDSQLERAVARPLAQSSVREILYLVQQRMEARDEIVRSTRAVTAETKGHAAAYSWKELGKETWRQIKTQIVARSLDSGEDGFDNELRVAFETELAEIVENGENVLAERIQATRTGARALYHVVPGVSKFIQQVDRIGTGILSKTILRAGQLDEHRLTQADRLAEAQDKYESSAQTWRDRTAALNTIRHSIREKKIRANGNQGVENAA